MPFISAIGIKRQIHVSIFRESKFFHVAIPMADADKKFLDVISRGIDAESLVSYVELQNAIMQERTDLPSYIHTMAAGAVLRRNQFAALRRR